MSEVAIVDQSRAKIIIRVLSPSDPGSFCMAPGSYWLNAEVEISVGGFSGHVQGFLTAWDFLSFRDQLATLYEILAGDAIFSTYEEWLYLKISGDGRGHLHTEGQLLDEPGTGNQLSFHLELDQSYIPNMLRGLDSIIQGFPPFPSEAT